MTIYRALQVLSSLLSPAGLGIDSHWDAAHVGSLQTAATTAATIAAAVSSNAANAEYV